MLPRPRTKVTREGWRVRTRDVPLQPIHLNMVLVSILFDHQHHLRSDWLLVANVRYSEAHAVQLLPLGDDGSYRADMG